MITNYEKKKILAYKNVKFNHKTIPAENRSEEQMCCSWGGAETEVLYVFIFWHFPLDGLV